MNKFTPGPWKILDYSKNQQEYHITNEERNDIALVCFWYEDNIPEAKANAHLIAAAPRNSNH